MFLPISLFGEVPNVWQRNENIAPRHYCEFVVANLSLWSSKTSAAAPIDCAGRRRHLEFSDLGGVNKSDVLRAIITPAADAVVFGDLMITLLKNADRVHAASLAQLVNVIAPIMTEPGGPAWRQTTFYPFALTAKYAKGGTVLEPKLSTGTFDTPRYGEVPVIDSVAVRGADGSVTVFVVNRSLQTASEFEVKLPEGFKASEVEARTLHEDDILARNTLEDQNRVTLHSNGTARLDADAGMVTATLPPVSWTAIHVK